MLCHAWKQNIPPNTEPYNLIVRQDTTTLPLLAYSFVSVANKSRAGLSKLGSVEQSTAVCGQLLILYVDNSSSSISISTPHDLKPYKAGARRRFTKTSTHPDELFDRDSGAAQQAQKL